MADEFLTINGFRCDLQKMKDRAYLLSITEGDEAFVNFLTDWFDSSDYVMGYTSGSTGQPKPIRLSKNAMRESARRTNAFFQMKSGTSILLCLSANYIAGKMMVVRALVGGIDLYLEKPSSTPLLDGKFDLVSMVPMQVFSLRNLKDGASRLANVKNLLVGGGPLPKEEAQWLLSLPLQTYVSYGMTETVSHVALASLNDTDGEGALIYKALPSVSFELDDRGCLVIHADYLSVDPLVTNDVVELCSSTSFLWKGRWDNVINTGGVKVHPELMERKIAQYIDREFYFTSQQDAKFGQKVVLVIEGEAFPTEHLMRNLQTSLSTYELPKEIRFLPEFPRTESGKIKRDKY